MVLPGYAHKLCFLFPMNTSCKVPFPFWNDLSFTQTHATSEEIVKNRDYGKLLWFKSDWAKLTGLNWSKSVQSGAFLIDLKAAICNFG